MTKRLYALGAGASLLCFAGTANAQSANLQVQATVTASCTVSTNTVDFGPVDVISGGADDASGDVTVTCTNGTPWSAAAGLGAGPGATFAARRMLDGANQLQYSLYTNAARTIVWGDGSGGTATVSNTGSGAAQTFDVYGRVASGQSTVPVGDYSDVVLVTVTY